ncbi:MAG: cytochrome c biogenesis protein CcdA [Chloroflexaceae bacterium]|nr:cytochrome c biogenesis protein CcdA [Chloroflexaceae bacterium]
MPTVETRESGKQPPSTNRRWLLIGGLALVTLLAIGILSINAGGSSINSGSVLVLALPAFLAGMFSLLSPCTLPILPAYFAFTAQAQKKSVVLMTVFFFLGLATTMTIIIGGVTALGGLLSQERHLLTVIGGLVIIGFGVMSVLGKGFAGLQMQDRPVATVTGSYLYGATFALGLTPCVGPILGALLTLVITTNNLAVIQGMLLAVIYALGMSAPLILLATAFHRLDKNARFWKFLRGKAFDLKIGPWTFYMHTTSVISGVLLIAMGVLLASGQLEAMTAMAQNNPIALWLTDLEYH